MGKLYDSIPDDLGMTPEELVEYEKTRPKIGFVQGSFVGYELAPVFGERRKRQREPLRDLSGLRALLDEAARPK